MIVFKTFFKDINTVNVTMCNSVSIVMLNKNLKSLNITI